MAIGQSFRVGSACYGSRSQRGRLHQRGGATGMQKRGGNDWVNSGSKLRGLEAGRVGKKGCLLTMGAGLCKPVAGDTAPSRIVAVGL